MLWMNQIFLHHVLWFLIKDDFQNRDCADGVDFGKYISRFDQFRITCLISRDTDLLRICTKHFESRGNVTFYQIKIYLTVKVPRGLPRLANINNDKKQVFGDSNIFTTCLTCSKMYM